MWKGKEMFYLTTHSTHFIYGYMASDIWLRTILIVRKETRCRHIGYSFWLTARVLLYAPSHRKDSTYHSLCYTSHGALAGTRNFSMGSPHEGSIRWPIAQWANALTTELHLAPSLMCVPRDCYCWMMWTESAQCLLDQKSQRSLPQEDKALWNATVGEQRSVKQNAVNVWKTIFCAIQDVTQAWTAVINRTLLAFIDIISPF